MVRRLSFGAILYVALALVACGRQITPNPPGLGPGGTPPGFMSVTFTVQGTLNFSNYDYLIVFNTSNPQSGGTPSTNVQSNNWAGYSYAIQVGGSAGLGTYAEGIQYIRTGAPHAPPLARRMIIPATLFQYNPNSNGTGSSFTVVFSRSVFIPTGASARVWLYNAFTTQVSASNQWLFLDSMGDGGPSPGGPQYPSPQLNLAQAFDQTYYATYKQVSDPNAEIYSIEIANNP